MSYVRNCVCPQDWDEPRKFHYLLIPLIIWQPSLDLWCCWSWSRRSRAPGACVVGGEWLNQQCSTFRWSGTSSGEAVSDTPHISLHPKFTQLCPPFAVQGPSLPQHGILQQDLSLKTCWKTDFHLFWGTLLLICSPSAVSYLYMHSLFCLRLVKGC